MERHAAWQRAVLQLLEWHIVRKEQRERELLTMRPEDALSVFPENVPCAGAAHSGARHSALLGRHA